METNIEAQQPTRDPRGVETTLGKNKARLRTDFHTGMIDYDEDSCQGPEKIEFMPNSGADDNENEKFSGLRIMVPPPPKKQSCWDPLLIWMGFTQIGNVLYRSIGKNGIRIVIGPQSIFSVFSPVKLPKKICFC
jgi:hypothetical protein